MKINFELDDQKWTIDQIKIRDYYQIKTDLLLDDTNSRYHIISVLSGCPIEILRDFTLSSWNEIWQNLELMIQVEMFNHQEVVHQFTHDGVEYGLLDFDKMTIGEFADLDVIISDPNADSRIHEILAVLYRPITGRKWKKNIVEKYDYDGFKHRSELFMDLSIGRARAVSGFFLAIARASLRTTPIYLKSPKKTQRMMEKEAQTMLQKGGTALLSDWPAIILSKFQELQNLESEKPSTSLPIAETRLNVLKKKISKWLKNITRKDDNSSLL
jgi:hypothetical protein